MSGSLTRKQRRLQEQKQRKMLKKIEKLASRSMPDSNGVTRLDLQTVGLPKLSDIISEYAAPLCGEDDTEEVYDIVSLCWNIGAYPKDISDLLWDMMIEPALEQFYNDPGGLLRKELKTIVNRRRAEHPDDPRFIIEFTLEPMSDDEMYLQITSRAMPPEKFLSRMLANAPTAMQRIQAAN